MRPENAKQSSGIVTPWIIERLGWSAEMAEAIRLRLPEIRYDPVSRLVVLARAEPAPLPDGAPYALVVTGALLILVVGIAVIQVVTTSSCAPTRRSTTAGLPRRMATHVSVSSSFTVRPYARAFGPP